LHHGFLLLFLLAGTWDEVEFAGKKKPSVLDEAQVAQQATVAQLKNAIFFDK
jgi:hypothetical protein